MALDLTIAIPVKNEESHLRGCLHSIGSNFAKHIVVIDSGSTDNTKQVASEFGIDIVDFDWNGKFPKKRNWYLRNHTPETEWVLFLDADEFLTEEFKSELQNTLSSEFNKVGYWLSYSIYFLGKELKGGYPLRKLALFRTHAGEYERIDEEQWSKLDMEIHEHPILNGDVGTIKSKIDHRDFRGVSHYIIKHNEYAKWEAARYLRSLKDIAIQKEWTWKQRMKYKLMGTIFIGPAYFFGSFFLLRGFRDGARGLAFAILKMSYFTQIYCNIRENNKNYLIQQKNKSPYKKLEKQLQ